jgi:hypothetical protein
MTVNTANVQTVEATDAQTAPYDGMRAKLNLPNASDKSVVEAYIAINAEARSARKNGAAFKAPDVLEVTAPELIPSAETLASQLSALTSQSFKVEDGLIRRAGSPHAVRIHRAEDGTIVGSFVTQRGRPFELGAGIRHLQIADRFARE